MYTFCLRVDPHVRSHFARSARGDLRGCPERCAFSLLEILIVMLVIGILAAVAAPKFYDSLMYHRAESAARRVKADLEQLRQTARRTSRTLVMTLGDTSYTLPEEIPDLERADGTYTVELLERPFQLNQASIEFAGNTSLAFDGYGVPSMGGSFVLQAGDHQRTVTLDGATGEIAISGND